NRMRIVTRVRSPGTRADLNFTIRNHTVIASTSFAVLNRVRSEGRLTRTVRRYTALHEVIVPLDPCRGDRPHAHGHVDLDAGPWRADVVATDLAETSPRLRWRCHARGLGRSRSRDDD